MKTIILILALAFAPALTSCSTPPAERSQAVMTLKVVGATRDAAMKVAGQLWREGKISDAKRDEIIAFHDNRLQPAYNLAVAAVQADLNSLANPELISLLGQLQALIK